VVDAAKKAKADRKLHATFENFGCKAAGGSFSKGKGKGKR
jgi:hypothetical protein